MLDNIALVIGWIVMVSGGIALCGFIAGLACTYGWRKYKDALSFDELRKAVQAYKGD